MVGGMAESRQERFTSDRALPFASALVSAVRKHGTGRSLLDALVTHRRDSVRALHAAGKSALSASPSCGSP